MKTNLVICLLFLGVLMFAACGPENKKTTSGDNTQTGTTDEKIGYRFGDPSAAAGTSQESDTSLDKGAGNASPGRGSDASVSNSDSGYSSSSDSDSASYPDYSQQPDYDGWPQPDYDQPAADNETPDVDIKENGYKKAETDPLSTFSIDVDGASYSLTRNYLKQGQFPPAESVRIEELVNYFNFHYPLPKDSAPFSVYTETSVCPWNLKHKLVMIGLQGQEIEETEHPAGNIVFLIDISGSMADSNKLPLIKKGLRMLAKQMRAEDKISIVVYATDTHVALESTPGDQKEKILEVINSLEADGSTNGAGGIQLAYEVAQKNFIEDGNNRIILSTDGDFNVGISDDAQLVEMIKTKRDAGVYLSIFGFGMGNYQDVKMEQLADNGNGNYYYIDDEKEATRAFVYEYSGFMLTLANDVKVQAQFNPAFVKAYRLIGYENRIMSNDEFNNTQADAGELGAGQSVTAFYEIIPADSSETVPEIPDEETDTEVINDADGTYTPDALTGHTIYAVRISYKEGSDGPSKEIDRFADSTDIKVIPSLKYLFGAAVTEFGMILRHSAYAEDGSFKHILERIEPAKKAAVDGAVQEFIDLTTTASGISN